jgi:uncharacterized protein YbjT (DUF2867 family)
MARVAVVGGHGKTGRAVCASLTDPVPLGRADRSDLAGAMAGCDAVYLIAPNLHPDEPAYVTEVLDAMATAGVDRIVYHSVASPYVPAMPHHMGKARSEDLVRRSGLTWTILQPGVYLQNFDLSHGPVQVPYDVEAPFGFLDLADLGAVAALVLTEDRHAGATYELASCQSSVSGLAADAGLTAERVADPGTHPWLTAMFGYDDRHGLPAGTCVLAALLERS